MTHDGGRSWQRQSLDTALTGIKANAYLDLTFLTSEKGMSTRNMVLLASTYSITCM